MSIILSRLKHDDIVTKFGGSGSRYDRVHAYFTALGFTSGRISEQELAFLADAGFTTGTPFDRWNAYLKDAGFTVGKLDDRLRAWARS